MNLRKENKMKTKVKSIAIAVFTITTIFWSCTKEPIIPRQTNNDAANVKPLLVNSNLITGRWIVSAYEGLDVKPAPINSFKGYSFKFNSNSVVTATKEGNRDIIGKWSYEIDKNTKWLVIDFGAQQLVLLSNKWQINTEEPLKIYTKGLKNDRPVYMNIERAPEIEKL